MTEPELDQDTLQAVWRWFNYLRPNASVTEMMSRRTALDLFQAKFSLEFGLPDIKEPKWP